MQSVFLFFLGCPKEVCWDLCCLLFTHVYINDIPNTLTNSEIFIFADDTKLIKRIIDESDGQLLQDDLSSIEPWCAKWKLRLNIDKCKVVNF